MRAPPDDRSTSDGATRQFRRPPWRAIRWAAIATLLLLPALAMQVSDEVRWTAFDFVIAGVLLAGAGLAYEVVTRVAPRLAPHMAPAPYHAGASLALVTALLLLWVTGAIGLIGTGGHAANLLYPAMLAAGAAGTLIGRFRARDMARTMRTLAIAQVAIAAAALTAGWGSEVDGWWLDITGATALFTALWLVASWLFARAAPDGTRGDHV